MTKIQIGLHDAWFVVECDQFNVFGDYFVAMNNSKRTAELFFNMIQYINILDETCSILEWNKYYKKGDKLKAFGKDDY